jgi:cation:H+ antiporter
MAYLFLLFVITKRKKKGDEHYQAPEIPLGPIRWKSYLLLDLTGLVLRGRSINIRRSWLLLMLSTLVMTGGTWLLVLATDMFGETTGMQLVFVAVILSAAATSVPDTVISLKDAHKGNYDDAVSNALGSNIFDIAFALGLPILLFTLFTGTDIVISGDILKFTLEVWAFLLLATLLALAILLFGKYFTRRKAILLLLIYALFLFYVGTQVEGVLEIEVLKGIGEQLGRFLEAIAGLIGGLNA